MNFILRLTLNYRNIYKSVTITTAITYPNQNAFLPLFVRIYLLKKKMELYRVDYTLLGLTYPNCMKVLPMIGAKFTQKIVVGDRDGVTHIFFLKKGEVQVTFKSLPGTPITNVVLGGSIGTVQDKVFVSSGNEVRGYTKKGKTFLNFETQLLENIKNMYVIGSDLLISGIHNFHHYHDCKLTDSYTCADVINDIIALNTLKVRRLIVVLACDDQMLRVLDGSTIVQTATLLGKPTKLCLFNNDGGNNGDRVLVGMQEGQIHLMQVTRSGPMVTLWTIESSNHRSEITCIICFDILKVNGCDIIVGRQDGNIEIYSGSQPDDVMNQYYLPTEKFSYSCNESITSIQGGYVGNVNFEEIAVTTYTGWFFGLTTEVPEKHVTANEHNDLTYGLSRDDKQRIARLKSEIEEIEEKVAKEREKYLLLTQDDSVGTSRLPYLVINDKMVLHKEDASYFITLETETNIDNVLIQCDVPIKLLDVDKNSAVVSYSKCEPSSGNAVLATYRCQLNTTRLELKFYTTEGQKGTLLAYVTPLTQPKCCQLRKFPIKPFSLHTRIHSTETNRPFNVLQLKGAFSLAEMHSWITQCLPEVPEKLPSEEKMEYIFESVLLNTVLICNYWRGDAEFKSDNISDISILKDFITKEATKKKIKLDISSVTNEESIYSTIRLLHPKLETYSRLEQQLSLLEALKDIDTAQSEPLIDSLAPEYKMILANEEKILNQKPYYLERLHNAMISLFTDWHKYKGLNPKPKLSLFIDTLKNHYNYEQLCSFFS